jgi:hypothetical protein
MFQRIINKIREAVSFQNLTKADKKGNFPWNWRAWIRLSEETQIRIQCDLTSDFHHVGVKVDPDEAEVGAFSAFAPFAIWVTLRNRTVANAIAPKVVRNDNPRPEPREIRISAHNGSIWWSFWMDPDNGRSDEPRYRRGSFAWDDLVFGKQTTEREVVRGTERIAIPMPEGVYAGNSTIERFTYRRPRARTLTKTMASVTMDPREDKSFRPIPVPGKGTESYNCDEDAIYSTSISVDANATHADAVAEVVRSVLKTRWRYGGKNWRPEAFRMTDAAPN